MAVIDAQAAAAQTTMDFIKHVGFDDDNQAINVTFSYDRVNSTSGVVESRQITVPLLTIIPVPFIRVRRSVAIFGQVLLFCDQRMRHAFERMHILCVPFIRVRHAVLYRGVPTCSTSFVCTGSCAACVRMCGLVLGTTVLQLRLLLVSDFRGLP